MLNKLWGLIGFALIFILANFSVFDSPYEVVTSATLLGIFLYLLNTNFDKIIIKCRK